MTRRILLSLGLAFLPLFLFAYPSPGAHPRLLLKAGEETEILQAIDRYDVMKDADSVLVSYCDNLLTLPVHPRKMAGFRIAGMNEILQRLFALSYCYRVHGAEAYADRAIEEMMNVAAYQDWNPLHYLDVAEITMGMAIGYDWLYDRLSPGQRAAIEEAIRVNAFESSKIDEYAWFYTAFQNWNQVCNAGLVYGAIATWDVYPSEAPMIVNRCLSSNYLTLREGYSPEGAYAEGYSYWGYGSAFQIMLIAGLEGAFGSDLGLMDNYPSFFRSGRFMQFMNRPTGLCFDYADCGRNASAQHMLLWLAKRTGDMSLMYTEMGKLRRNHFAQVDMQRLIPFFLICGKDVDFSEIPEPGSGAYVAGGLTPVYLYRSGWNSPDDDYLGIKAGVASSNHSHMDVGSFVFDSDGVTWAEDLGMQNYLSLEEKGVDLWNRWQWSGRYDVFRIGPFSHNIITVNGHKPDVYQYINFASTWDEPGRNGAEMDLHMLYWEDLKRYVRSISLEDGTLCMDEDMQAGDADAEVCWSMCTTAEAEIVDGITIRLSRGGHSRLLKLVSAEGAQPLAAIWSNDPPHDYDYPNPGSMRAGFRLTVPAGASAKFRIELQKEK